MKKLLVLICLLTTGCINARVPARIDAVASGTVDYRVHLDASLEIAFQKNCQDLAKEAGFKPGTQEYASRVDQCVIDLTQQFISLLGGK